MNNINDKLQELLGKPQKDIYQVLGQEKPTLESILSPKTPSNSSLNSKVV
jgi:hypothetical protein